jgi:hypothetical protein
MDLRSIAHALGGEVCGRQVVAPGPNHSRKDRSLSIRRDPDAPDGFLVHSHAGDDWQLCRDYVRCRLGMPAWQPGDDRHEQRTIRPGHISKWDSAIVDAEAEDRLRTEDDLVRIGRVQAIWEEAISPELTKVDDYFRARAIKLPNELAGTVLRYHPRCPWRNEKTGQTDRIPCLIAAFRSIDDDMITAIHRIRVDQPQRWPKTERKMLGRVHRAAVKLGPATVKLTIGEGIETCLAALQLGLGPAWALGSVGNISRFPLLDNVDELTILAEPGTDREIQICGRRWKQEGRRVLISRSSVGSDHNDILMRRAS